jgi:anti-sigma regulatory factor (Ser/Thr protein kinase)
MELRRADWVLAAQKESVPEARALVADRLAGLAAGSLDIVLVLTSELVTNAIRHGVGPVSLQVVWDTSGVRVDVYDDSPQRPVLRGIDQDAPNGRGLLLVDALSDSWGVEPRGAGKAVWFTCAV